MRNTNEHNKWSIASDFQKILYANTTRITLVSNYTNANNARPREHSTLLLSTHYVYTQRRLHKVSYDDLLMFLLPSCVQRKIISRDTNLSSIPSMLPMTLQRCTTPSISSEVILNPRYSSLTIVYPMNPNWASAMSNCVGLWTPASLLFLNAIQCFRRTIFRDSKNLQ